MPQEIKLSQLKDRAQFEQAVADHITKLKAFSTQVGVPRPVAHPLIEASVKRISYPKASKKPDDFEPDYNIVDDTPPPPPPLSLEDRKAQLFHALRAAEQQAAEKVVPVMKRRLLNMNAARAFQKAEADRTDEDKAVIADFNAKQEAFKAIELKAAEAEAALEDVTEDNIDSWQVPNFG